jgi:DNA-binding LacI/PurR family transcriptional regulator
MLLPPHGSLNPPWAGFPWENYSIVRFGRSLENPVTHLVTADQVTNTTVAFQAMRERGYRKIGFVTKEVDMKPRGHHFSAGFLAIREMLDKSERIPIFKVTDESAGKVAASFKKWLAANRPDAILTACAGTRELLDGAGCRVPRDIGLAVTSILDGGADSGIDQHPEEIGRVGFLMLKSLLNDGSRGIPKIFRQNLVEGSWVDGASLPDRRPG